MTNYNETKNGVQFLLDQAGRIPLLTPEEEITLSKQIKSLIKIEETEKHLQAKLNRNPTIKEIANLLELQPKQVVQRRQIGEKARQKMVEANLRLVVSIAKKYTPKAQELNLLDLIQEGTFGLRRAAEKFDPTKGYKFSTYAYWWIRQAITRAIAEKSRTIRLPIHITEKINKLKKHTQQLNTLNRQLTLAELSDKTGMSQKEIEQVLHWWRLPLSLNQKAGKEKDLELIELAADDHHPSPETQAENHFLQEILSSSLDNLEPLERQVIELRFGLKGKSHTLQETSNLVGRSRKRIRQLENRALTKLRQTIDRRKIADYLED